MRFDVCDDTSSSTRRDIYTGIYIDEFFVVGVVVVVVDDLSAGIACTPIVSGRSSSWL